MSKKTLEQKIEKWDDTEVLENLAKFLESGRVTFNTQFVETEEGMFTHQLMTIRCGDKVIVSEPQELDWPVQLMPMPEAFNTKDVN